MYFISLSVTLLTIIASLFLLAKVRNENLGIFSKLVSYLVLILALLMLVCQLIRGVDKMEKGRCEKEGCSKEMRMGGEGNMMCKHGEGDNMMCRHGKGEGCNKGGENMSMGEAGGCTMKEGKPCPANCKDSATKAQCKMHKDVEVTIEGSGK